MNESYAVNVEDVSKSFGSFKALNGVTLRVRQGEIYGLLGPNGSGKSTLMRILATITKATSGRVLWNGTNIAHKPDAVRNVLGYLPQDFGMSR